MRKEWKERMKKPAAISLTALGALLLVALLLFFGYPNLNPLYPDGFVLWAVVFDIAVAAVLIARQLMGKSKHAREDFRHIRDGKDFIHFLKPGMLGLVLILAPWVFCILTYLYSTVLFHVGAYKNQMPEPQNRTFSSDVQPLDVDQLPVVDEALATQLADKQLGDNPALGSQVVLGDPTIQKVDGKLEWVVPLLHSGFFKWASNVSGTPGYIVVSATNPRDVKYVPQYKIKYQPNAYFFDLLERHIRLCGGFFSGLTDYSFEIDDSGRPYWVVTTYRNLVGFSLPEATGAWLVDAATGAMHHYAIKNLPSWVDRVQPEEYIMTQIDNRGQYIHGYLNFSNKDKFESEGSDAIVYYNNHCYLYTVLTSVGQDESAIGFMLVDMVTKAPYRYLMSGATAYAAQQSAEGKVQNYKYTASFPLITNVDGRATYFMTLKDSTGLIKMYAFVNVADYTTVGTGDTLDDAMTDYESNLKNTGNTDITAGGATKTLTGTVSRIAAQVNAGNTVYYLTLDNAPGRIFTAVADLNAQLPLTKAGDSVTVAFIQSNAAQVALTSFDNRAIAAATSEAAASSGTASSAASKSGVSK